MTEDDRAQIERLQDQFDQFPSEAVRAPNRELAAKINRDRPRRRPAARLTTTST